MNPDTDIQRDTLQKFLFDNNPVRGELVDLSHSWQQVQERHDYPPIISHTLGEMLAACTLLSANLKFDGTIIMQIHGDGPVKLLVAECNSQMQIRATAKLQTNEAGQALALEADASLASLINRHGQGRFLITLDPAQKQPGQTPYQGIVPLDGEDIATMLENYMLRSEQLDTRLWLAADGQVARGLLLQKLPDHGGKADAAEQEQGLETWNRASTLGATVKREELLSTDIDTLMRRLFWEEDLRVFEPQAISFHCTCSRERVGNMLKMLGTQEVENALQDLGSLNIHCDFCGQAYDFDAVDCAQLFIGDGNAGAGSSSRH